MVGKQEQANCSQYLYINIKAKQAVDLAYSKYINYYLIFL